MTEKIRQPRYTKEIKLEAIRQVLHDNKPVHQVIRDLGIRHRDNVYEWLKKYKKSGEAAFDSNHLLQEVPSLSSEVEKEVKQLRLENEILKKFQAILRGKG